MIAVESMSSGNHKGRYRRSRRLSWYRQTTKQPNDESLTDLIEGVIDHLITLARASARSTLFREGTVLYSYSTVPYLPYLGLATPCSCRADEAYLQTLSVRTCTVIISAYLTVPSLTSWLGCSAGDSALPCPALPFAAALAPFVHCKKFYCHMKKR